MTDLYRVYESRIEGWGRETTSEMNHLSGRVGYCRALSGVASNELRENAGAVRILEVLLLWLPLWEKFLWGDSVSEI